MTYEEKRYVETLAFIKDYGLKNRYEALALLGSYTMGALQTYRDNPSDELAKDSAVNCINRYITAINTVFPE